MVVRSQEMDPRSGPTRPVRRAVLVPVVPAVVFGISGHRNDVPDHRVVQPGSHFVECGFVIGKLARARFPLGYFGVRLAVAPDVRALPSRRRPSRYARGFTTRGWTPARHLRLQTGPTVSSGPSKFRSGIHARTRFPLVAAQIFGMRAGDRLGHRSDFAARRPYQELFGSEFLVRERSRARFPPVRFVARFTDAERSRHGIFHLVPPAPPPYTSLSPPTDQFVDDRWLALVCHVRSQRRVYKRKIIMSDILILFLFLCTLHKILLTSNEFRTMNHQETMQKTRNRLNFI